MPYQLYQPDNTTPVAVPQQIGTTFNPVSREPFNDGGRRASAFYVVEWRFKQPMSQAQYQLLQTYIPDSGRTQFMTWRPAKGATAGAFVKCEGVLAEIGGQQVDYGDFYNVFLKFVAVRIL